MAYSFNLKKEPFVFAHGRDINVSYKDLGAVCDAIRYLKVGAAMDVLDDVMSMSMPVLYRRHNTYMGSRHELGGQKGKWPVKAAKEAKVILVNAVANSASRGLSADDLYVVHASATKTQIARRSPSKGSLSWGRGKYGRSASVHSDLEYARIEIGLGTGREEELSKNMKFFIMKKNKGAPKAAAVAKPKAAPKKAAKEQAKKEEHVHDHVHEHEHPHAEAKKPVVVEASK
ncbi:50S ribosomal protein L22 [uncultured archaeon]|nr:50S ribosomal protein L22 [uncultured archaeon]